MEYSDIIIQYLNDKNLILESFFVSIIPTIDLYLISVASCFFISFLSMFTLFIFLYFIKPCKEKNKKENKTEFDPQKSEFLKLILAFAVGSLLADVFLHIIPDASFELSQNGYSIYQSQHFLGVWILIGIVLFASMETFFQIMCSSENEHENVANLNQNEDLFQSYDDDSWRKGRQHMNKSFEKKKESIKNSKTIVDATGYLNLIANGFDNFSHGMSVAASYLISYKMGILTTIAIAIHEIPHEIVDFVILIRSGFTYFDAFRAQVSISLITVLGSCTVLYFDLYQRQSGTTLYTIWILPLTCGGFIYIALTSLLPELLKLDNLEDFIKDINNLNKKEMCLHKLQTFSKRICFVILGIVLMATVNAFDL